MLASCLNLSSGIVSSLSMMDQEILMMGWQNIVEKFLVSAFGQNFFNTIKTFCCGGDSEPFNSIPVYINVNISPFSDFVSDPISGSEVCTSKVQALIWHKNLRETLSKVFMSYPFTDEMQLAVDIELMKAFLGHVHKIFTKYGHGKKDAVASITHFVQFSLKLHYVFLDLLSFADEQLTTPHSSEAIPRFSRFQTAAMKTICRELGCYWDLLMYHCDDFQAQLAILIDEKTESEYCQKKSKETLLFFDFLLSINGSMKLAELCLDNYGRSLSKTLRGVVDATHERTGSRLIGYNDGIECFFKDFSSFVYPLLHRLPEFYWGLFGRFIAMILLNYNKEYDNLITSMYFSCSVDDKVEKQGMLPWNLLHFDEVMHLSTFSQLDLGQDEVKKKVQVFLSENLDSVLKAVLLMKEAYQFIQANKFFTDNSSIVNTIDK